MSAFRLSLITLGLAALGACQGRPPSIGHFDALGFDQGAKHPVPPDVVVPCSAEERDSAFENTTAYLHSDEDDRARPTTACCTPGSNRWDFLLPPYPEHGHSCRVVRWERDGFIYVEHKYADCDTFRQRDVCTGMVRR